MANRSSLRKGTKRGVATSCGGGKPDDVEQVVVADLDAPALEQPKRQPRRPRAQRKADDKAQRKHGLIVPERYAECIHVEPNTGCWLWSGATNSRGYSSIRKGDSARQGHLVIYELVVGRLPRGLHELDHLCRTRACVNPAHLEPVTRGENNRRSTCHRHPAFLAQQGRKKDRAFAVPRYAASADAAFFADFFGARRGFAAFSAFSFASMISSLTISSEAAATICTAAGFYLCTTPM